MCCTSRGRGLQAVRFFWEAEWEEVRIIHLSLFRVSCSLEPIDFDSRLRFCSSAGVDWGKACTHRRGWETCDAHADAGRLSELAHQSRRFHEMASATDRKWGQSGYVTESNLPDYSQELPSLAFSVSLSNSVFSAKGTCCSASSSCLHNSIPYGMITSQCPSSETDIF